MYLYKILDIISIQVELPYCFGELKVELDVFQHFRGFEVALR